MSRKLKCTVRHAQFALLMAQALYGTFWATHYRPRIVVELAILQAFIFICLFANFYRRAAAHGPTECTNDILVLYRTLQSRICSVLLLLMRDACGLQEGVHGQEGAPSVTPCCAPPGGSRIRWPYTGSFGIQCAFQCRCGPLECMMRHVSRRCCAHSSAMRKLCWSIICTNITVGLL